MAAIDIYSYIQSKYNRNEDYMSVLMLLPYATMGSKKAFEMLLCAEKSSKKFKAYYPAYEKLDMSIYDTVGTIPDGVLLIEK